MPDNRRSVISLDSFARGDLIDLFQAIDRLRQLPDLERRRLCLDRTLATLFFQPSTRTRFSFESAILYVGGSYIDFGHPAMTKASAGETLEDTVRVLEGYADVLVIRHSRDDAARVASNLTTVPIINAGCGTLEHPTQALVDLYTIYDSVGSIDGLTIGLLGDLRTQRAVNSLIIGLSRFDVRLHLVSHSERRLRAETRGFLKDVWFQELDDFREVLPDLDVLYVIRIDRDRTSGPADYDRLRGDRQVRGEDLNSAKEELKVLNPLPRDDELHESVDATSHAHYFRQAHLGRFVRAALLAITLES